MPASIPWRKSVLIGLLWPVGLTLLGIAAATASGEHGSIIFVAMGLIMGLCGAASHASLLLWARYRALPTLLRVLSVWATSMMLFLIVGALLAQRPTEVFFMVSYVAIPAILAAAILEFVLARNNAA